MSDRFKALKESFHGIEPIFREISVTVLERVRMRSQERWPIMPISDVEAIEILQDALTFFLDNSNYSERIAGYFRATGARYYPHGVRLEHYEIFIEEWMKALESLGGRTRFQSHHRASWQMALKAMLQHLGEGILQSSCQIAS